LSGISFTSSVSIPSHVHGYARWRYACAPPHTGRTMARFTIYFATDIHGSETCFRKFLNAGAFYEVDAVILGGDVAGKGLIPITQGANGTWETFLFGKAVRLGSEDELDGFERRMRLQGFYPYRTTPDEVEQLGKHGEALDRAFEHAIGRSVEDWVKLADEKLKDAGIPCLVMPGNDDPPLVKRAMNEAAWLTQAEDRIVELGPYQVLSLGYSTPTPWDSPREITEDEMRTKLGALATQLDPDTPTIFNVHNPPFDTGTDRAYQLTSDMRIRTAGGEPTFAPVGSVAVREAIEHVQPILGLHGHIHESRAMGSIGRTKVCNPGSLYTEGALQGVIVSLDGDRVKAHKFVTG
jgi:Icc-related predicted phosphoesterase